MCKINNVKRFIVNGVKTFRSAAFGTYDGESDSVKEIRKEMFDSQKSDSANLRSDRKNIEGDIRNGFNKIIMGNA